MRKPDYRKVLLKIAENWTPKVISVVLAILLFAFYKTASMEERFFLVPLHVETDGNYTPSSPYDQTIHVSLRGEANSIYPILEDDIIAYIDLKGKDKGTYRVPIQIRKKGTALGVDPLEIKVEPSEVSLSIDHKVSKMVSLKTNIRGSLRSGYQLAGWSLMPEYAAVDGPADVLAHISELFTEDVELNDRDSDFSIVVNILNHEPLAIIRGGTSVEFKGIVQEILSQKNYENIPITLKNIDSIHWTAILNIDTGSISVEGRQRDLDRYTALDVFSVNCAGIQEPGTFSLPVDVNLPVYLNVTASAPKMVTVTVQEVEPSDIGETAIADEADHTDGTAGQTVQGE
jgi:YbbR domain-containing protein